MTPRQLFANNREFATISSRQSPTAEHTCIVEDFTQFLHTPPHRTKPLTTTPRGQHGQGEEGEEGEEGEGEKGEEGEATRRGRRRGRARRQEDQGGANSHATLSSTIDFDRIRPVSGAEPAAGRRGLHCFFFPRNRRRRSDSRNPRPPPFSTSRATAVRRCRG